MAIFFTLLWYKRKRTKKSYIDKIPITEENSNLETTPTKSEEIQSNHSSPVRSPFSRSLSGVDTAPIDIKTNRSPVLIVSDKDLDFEIEKMKSMKSTIISHGSDSDTSMTEKMKSSNSSSPENKNSTSSTPVIKKCKSPGCKSPNQSPINMNSANHSLENGICMKTSPNQSPRKELPNQKQTNRNSFDQSPVTLDIRDSAREESHSPNQKQTNRKSLDQSPISLNLDNLDLHDSANHSPIEQTIQEMTQTEEIRETINQSPGIRDSANHSPADAMLASPSCSIASDGHHSDSDSGKGGSDVATPPPLSQDQQEATCTALLTSKYIIHEFVIPQNLVGRLIGRHGVFVHQIKAKTNANILIKRHPENAKGLKVCAVEGTQPEVDAALDMIREKFPEKRYSDLTLEHVTFETAALSLVPECMHLKLIEGINNDTIVSCMVTPRHLFLQQPTHPTFPSLNVLSAYMNACYSPESLEAPPLLPMPIKENTICAAHSLGAWYRAMVLSTENEISCSVKFLDYGGYAAIDQSMLRQIRGDFLLLPFQSSECLLANVQPLAFDEDGSELWPQEAFDLVADLTKGAVVFTQVVDYLEDCTPLVYIYVRTPEHVIFLNKEIVNRGLAVWEEADGNVNA